MKIDGAYLIDGPTDSGYTEDVAGSCRDIYLSSEKHPTTEVPNHVEVRRLSQRALRGIHHATYAKVVSCVMGKCFVVVVDLRPESTSFSSTFTFYPPSCDSPSGVVFREWEGFWLTAEDHSHKNPSVNTTDRSVSGQSKDTPSALSLRVPPRCGVATFSLTGAIVLLHHCGGEIKAPLPFAPHSSPTTLTNASPMPAGVVWSDPSINVSWPLTLNEHPSVTFADASLPFLSDVQSAWVLPNFSCDVLLYGSTGYFGSFLLRHLRSSGVDVCCSTTRLEDHSGLLRDSALFRPRRVINCAGVTGSPNIMWCETHKPETAKANFTGLLNLLDVFAPLDVHVTTIGTGIIHCYDDMHRLDNDVGYTEADPPTYDGNVYVRLRVAQEQMVEEVFPKKCLTLRVQYPISSDMHPGCCLSKLLKYPKIFGLPTSMTVLDDLFPQINQLSLNKVTGPLNFTNPGRMDNVSLLNAYKDIVDNSITFECGSPEEMVKFLTIPRPFSLLDTTRLLEVCPGVLPLQEAVQRVLEQVASQRKKQEKDSI